MISWVVAFKSPRGQNKLYNKLNIIKGRYPQDSDKVTCSLLRKLKFTLPPEGGRLANIY